MDPVRAAGGGRTEQVGLEAGVLGGWEGGGVACHHYFTLVTGWGGSCSIPKGGVVEGGEGCKLLIVSPWKLFLTTIFLRDGWPSLAFSMMLNMSWADLDTSKQLARSCCQ